MIGLHNAENIAASFAVARYFEIKHDCILNALKNFEGLPHRLEIVLKTGNVIFVNDSKATNVASTRSALSSFDKIYWIVGGISKDEGIAALSDLFRKVTHAFLIGQSTENFAAVLEKYKIPYFKCATLENAFNEIMTFPELDGVVLLSPACSSLDQWKNFEARGEAFRSLVKNRFS